MKTTQPPVPFTVRALGRIVCLAACLLLTAPSALVAADDITLNTFDTTAGDWQRWWGLSASNFVFEWDGTVDASNSPTSGSLKVTIFFDYPTYQGENQFALYSPFSQVLGSQYTNLTFDLRWDPSSPMRTEGDHGWLEPGFRNADWSQNWLPGLTVPVNAGWKHVVLPINPTADKIDTINGVVLKMWNGNQAAYTGRATFWVDNIKLIARTNLTVPPPQLAIEKAVPGLRVFASAAGSQYQRQSIRTLNPAYSWVGATDPVTYSMTVADYPGGGYSGFQTHLFIVPGNNLPTWETSPDWNEPNVVFLHLQNNANGSAYCAFRYKTNQPGGNSMLFGSGVAADVSAPSPVGTWNLTFNPGGAISLAAPNGNVTNFSLPTEVVNLFNGPAYAYFGIQPNQLANIGRSSTFSRIQITGVATPIDDPLTSNVIDTTKWQVIAENTVGLVPVPADAALWLNWTLPDNGYRWEVIPDVTAAEFLLWTDFPVTGVQIGDYKRAIVLKTQLPPFATGNYFFNMVSP